MYSHFAQSTLRLTAELPFSDHHSAFCWSPCFIWPCQAFLNTSSDPSLTSAIPPSPAYNPSTTPHHLEIQKTKFLLQPSAGSWFPLIPSCFLFQPFQEYGSFPGLAHLHTFWGFLCVEHFSLVTLPLQHPRAGGWVPYSNPGLLDLGEISTHAVFGLVSRHLGRYYCPQLTWAAHSFPSLLASPSAGN